MRWASLVFMPLPMLGGAACQAMGKNVQSFMLYSANLLFFVPVVLLMAEYFGMNGIWWASVISNCAATVLMLLQRFFQGKKCFIFQ